MGTRGRWIRRALVAALATAMVAGPLGAGRAWAGKKSIIKAKIADGKFKVNRKPGATAAGGTYENVTSILNIVGGSAKLKGRGLNTTVEIKALSMTTEVQGLESATLPLTVPVELTTFSRFVTQGAAPVSQELWYGEGVTLTIQRYKNGRLKGTFEGTIPAGEGASTDAVVEKGKFSVLLNAPAI